jgi:multicomponent K+:H+ antiporter subunit A
MSTDAILLTVLVVMPFVGSVVAALLPTNAHDLEAWWAAGIAFIGLAIASTFSQPMAEGAIVRAEFEWVPQLGLNFILRLDGFAWSFVVLVCLIGLLVILYARYYIRPEDPASRFFSYLLGFKGAMLGIVLSGNLLQLVFFWELTSLYSFLLIGYWYQNQSARDGARLTLTVTATGGLCLLAGVLLLGQIVGSYNLDDVLAAGSSIINHSLYLPILLLIAVGVLTKSAQFPFHFWLPRAMAAPTPVSAYLHSAAMVKAGIFLLARLWPVMAGHDLWFWIFTPLGVTTLLIGAFLALFQQDLKGLLAYSTISHLGLITLLLGLGSRLAAVAAVFHIMNHATFKASLFMAAGVIDHEAGTRDIRQLGGLYRTMPTTATLAIVAAAAMAGVPLLNGFLSKEMFFAETIEPHVVSTLDDALPYLATIAGIFSVAYSLRLIHQVFFGPPANNLPRTPHDPVTWMLLPVAFLVLMCILVGVAPQAIIGGFLKVAIIPVVGQPVPNYSLAVWHGFTPAFFMSLVALVGGVSLYTVLHRQLAGEVEGPPILRHLKGRRLFERAVALLSWRGARPLVQALSSNRLQPQIALLLTVAVLAGVWPLFQNSITLRLPKLSEVDVSFLLVWVVGCLCAIGAAISAKFHRFAAVVMMGGAGLSTSITFAWGAAPDLALTQLLVEIVTTVLLLLGLRWLPKRQKEPDGPVSPAIAARRVRDFIIAVAGGFGVGALAYAIMTRPLTFSVSSKFLELAYPEAGGRNVVNVILVDFRAFDTLGEITVLGAVAITVYALLRRFRPAPDSVALPEQKYFQDVFDEERKKARKDQISSHYMFVPGLILRLLFPLVAMVSVFLFLRGHDLPGGGFVAGLTFAIAFLLQYMAGGARWVEARLTVLPVRWIGFGLLAAGGTGIAAALFGRPFLTSAFQYVDIPLLGSIPVASALLFDLGVYALVLGATVLMLIALAHQAIRVPRPMTKEERVTEGAA